MAEAISSEKDLFICSVCLDFLNVPVTLNCGHNYCMGCINRFWDHEDLTGIYSCPQCRQTFNPRPVLKKNTVFAELVAQFRKKTAALSSIPLAVVDGDVSGEQQGHGTVLASAVERAEKEKQLVEAKRQFQQRLQEREKMLQEMRQVVETLKSSAQIAVEESERIFAEMIRSIEEKRSEVMEMIRAQEKAEVNRAEGLLKQLEQEIAELKRRDAEIEQLMFLKDPEYFLKNFQSVISPPQSMDFSNVLINQTPFFEAVVGSVYTLKDELQTVVSRAHVEVAQVQISTEPVTREDFLKYSCDFKLDPDTAHRNLLLSEGDKRVEYGSKVSNTHQSPYHQSRHCPERFEVYYQVLCKEGVSGRCYWEVERSGVVDVAVSYKSFNRCAFGWNDQSWSLVLSTSSSSLWHNSKEIKLPAGSSRIGVYVDHEAGTLAFYSISDTMTLLHRVQTTFTDALYPGFCVGPSSSVKLL